MNTKDYRAALAESFVSVLEENQLNWRKGWNAIGEDAPRNGVTDYRYKGINRFLLSLVAMQRGYDDPRWCTFHQIQKEGWKLVNAKEQGVKVEYWFPYDLKEKKSLTWKEYQEAEEDIQNRCIIRAAYKTVFNASLIEGIEPFPAQIRNEIHPDTMVDLLLEEMKVRIKYDGGDSAYYNPMDDSIHMPLPTYFNSDYEYDSTALHELAHATGAPHRLNRTMGRWGTPEYAFEELVAEISSCFMGVYRKAEQTELHIENHKAYVQHWANKIRENPEVLIKAIQEAEKATTYMEYKIGVVKQEEYKRIMEPPQIKAAKSISYEDAFFVDKDAKTVTWIYHNPDSNAGGQYVINQFEFPAIEESAVGNENEKTFFAYLESVSSQTLADIHTEEYEEIERAFRQNPDFTSCSPETMQQLIAIASNVPNEPLPLEGHSREIQTNMGSMSIEDYREIVALQNGFDSYEDLRRQGYDLDIPGDKESVQVPDTMSLEERYTKALALVGYERLPDPKNSMATIAFYDPKADYTLPADGAHLLREEVEENKPYADEDIKLWEQYVHPQGRISYYTRNLGGTGQGADLETKVYPDFQSALKDYLTYEVDGRSLGFLLNGQEAAIASFDIVDMKHMWESPRTAWTSDTFAELTLNEMTEMENNLSNLEKSLQEDNLYYQLCKSFDEVAEPAVNSMILQRSEWGSWIGHSVNKSRPQDYVAIDISGYNTKHEIRMKMDVIAGNILSDSAVFTTSVNTKDWESGVRDAFADLRKQAFPYLKTAVTTLDTNISAPMITYSHHTENALTDHYELLVMEGYRARPIKPITFTPQKVTGKSPMQHRNGKKPTLSM